jgi:magnesium-transporting ATPase (P-type)
MVFAMI